MGTVLGLTEIVLIRGVSLFHGLFAIHKVCLGPCTVPALEWMLLFQECLQGKRSTEYPIVFNSVQAHVHAVVFGSVQVDQVYEENDSQVSA